MKGELFSSFISLYILIILYLPSFFLNLIFSPVFLSAAILLLSILRLGAAAPHKETQPPQLPGSASRVSFLEWDVGAPLEAIQEEDDGSLLQRYPSLSRYYPETDSDSDSESDSDSCSSMDCFRWARDEEKYGLIEIQLHPDSAKNKKRMVQEFEFHTEEDNFIEIDISLLPST